MTDTSSSSALDRIERALARIETAGARAADNADIARRHQALRARVAEAVEALDAVIARGGEG